MNDQIFDANELEWEDRKHGMSKILVGDKYTKSSRVKLFCLEPGEIFKSHEHEFMQCLYFTSGQGKVSVDDTTKEVAKGLTVIVLPKQCHSVENTGEDDMEILVVDILEHTSQSTPYVDF